MQRNTLSFPLIDEAAFKCRILAFANRFEIFCCLESNHYPDEHHTYDSLFAIGATDFFSPQENILNSLKYFLSTQDDWLFGHVNYDFKNETAPLKCSHPDKIGFPEIFLFQPEIVIECKNGEAVISCKGYLPEKIFDEINNIQTEANQKIHEPISIMPRMSKSDYLSVIEKLQQHILRGDCYEINFCQEFFAENTEINPLDIYQKLSAIFPSPFSAFYRLHDKYLICASPERYFKKTGNKIIAQPMKGTLQRKGNDKEKDILFSRELYNSEKNRSENVMIVDLVRNDLSKICEEGSVKVNELFGVYSFPNVYQMVSTIEGRLTENIDFEDILKATFPMGSMTGAPKSKVIELTEKYEQAKRGIYSGCIGYISPENEIDFNVVIRSIMYNATEKYLNFLAGGAITFYSNPEDEYEECLLKASAMKDALQ